MRFFKEYKVVQGLLSRRHPVIFYSESRHYYQYFEQLLTSLTTQHNVPVLYITSDMNDPLLVLAPAGLEVVYVYWWTAFLFSRLKADVFVMTMTDLDNYAFKRSMEVGHYVYVFHAMVSTHQQYNAKAFFHYDAIFCPGYAQVNEIKAAEKLYNLSQKALIEYGYPLADLLREKITMRNAIQQKHDATILIAPSWFEQGIFDTCLEALVQQLALLPYKIMIRPHPEYVKRRKKKMIALQDFAKKIPAIAFDFSTDVTESLLSADILITDRSGIAFEYALGIQKPVLFIDTALKIMNADWQKLQLEPLESRLRSQLGVSILPAEIDKIDQSITKLESLQATFPAQAEQLQKDFFFNSSSSYERGVSYILSKIKY